MRNRYSIGLLTISSTTPKRLGSRSPWLTFIWWRPPSEHGGTTKSLAWNTMSFSIRVMCWGTVKCGMMGRSQYYAISEIGSYIHLKYFASQKRPSPRPSRQVVRSSLRRPWCGSKQFALDHSAWKRRRQHKAEGQCSQWSAGSKPTEQWFVQWYKTIERWATRKTRESEGMVRRVGMERRDKSRVGVSRPQSPHALPWTSNNLKPSCSGKTLTCVPRAWMTTPETLP